MSQWPWHDDLIQNETLLFVIKKKWHIPKSQQKKVYSPERFAQVISGLLSFVYLVYQHHNIPQLTYY